MADVICIILSWNITFDFHFLNVPNDDCIIKLEKSKHRVF